MIELTTDQALGFIADILCMCNGTLEDKHVNGCPQDKVAKDWLMQVQSEAKAEAREEITGHTVEAHQLLIEAGDEQLWCRCTCGWKVPECFPSLPTLSLKRVWDAWYWPHAIKEHIKMEEGE